MKTDHIQMLCDISELNHLFRDSFSIDNFLQQAVEMVASHTSSEVCSIYLYDDVNRKLVLRATKGLNKDCIGKVRFDSGQGLTGLSLKELRPLNIQKASKHPNYVYVSNSYEEAFDNFLAIPIARGLNRIGVLVLQRSEKRIFDKKDVTACQAVASQLANIIENAKFLIDIHETEEQPPKPITDKMIRIKSQIASEGFSFSFAKVYDKSRNFEILHRQTFTDDFTLEDFDRAVAQTEEQLETLQEKVEARLSDAASLIFASHLMIIKDSKFTGKMRELIKEGINPAQAVMDVVNHYIEIFNVSKNHRMREKVLDVKDLAVRIIGNLIQRFEQLSVYSNRIVVAEDIYPSELLAISSQDISGIILVTGGVTSHIAILARSLKIPMLIANDPVLFDVTENTKMILDAEAGNIYINPTEEVISDFQEREHARVELFRYTKKLKPQTHTKDGKRIKLMANINLLSDVDTANQMQCEGIGLYRTEFPFIIRNDFPTEEEQFLIYSRLVEKMKGKPITFRTLDIGGDKMLSYYGDPKEQNPSMGMRSIRFSLQHEDIFKTQIKAILRAGCNENIRLMFPMISSLDDFLRAKDSVKKSIEELSWENEEFNDSPELGMMVELPSITYVIKGLAQVADFFSIGTNDFIQFMLGADRTNEKVAEFYIPHHPAVMRAFANIVKVVKDCGKDISICGDMAHHKQYIPFLLGIGVETLSLNPTYLPRIKRAIESLDMEKAEDLTSLLLSIDNLDQIEELLQNFSRSARL